MCIIILNRIGRLPISTLKESAKNNPDGGGIMYENKGKIYMERSLDTKKIIEVYYLLRDYYPNKPLFIHFRIATDGDIDVQNCHPYKVSNKVSVMHNGILINYSNRNTDQSDTRLFIGDILSNIPEEQLYTNWMRKLLQQAIGQYNKLVFLNSQGRFMIVNEDMGHWDKQKLNWFSNITYQRPLRKKGKKVFITPSPPLSRRTTAVYPKFEFCDVCGAEVYPWENKMCVSCSSAYNAVTDFEKDTD